MIKIVNLQNTLNPITAAERVKLNQNWDEIRRAFSQIQLQVNFLAGGTEVDEIITRIDNAIQMAERGAQDAIDSVNQALLDLNVAITNVQTATQQANEAKDNAISATNNAMNAINEIYSIVNDFRSLGEWNNTNSYKRNNIVSLNGNSYIALIDNSNTPVTNTSAWTLFAQRGQDGLRGPQGEAGASLNIRGVLPNESSLPSTGEPGDAYTILGDLYVWSPESLSWVNVGQIKGEKGDKGEKGENGYMELAFFEYSIEATSNGQTNIEIPLSNFVDTDNITLFRNGVKQAKGDYTVLGKNITLNEAVTNANETVFDIVIIKGVLTQPPESIDANFLTDGTVNKNKLNLNLQSEINSNTEHTGLIATVDTLGHVKPDGSTITIDSEGVISSSGGGGKGLEAEIFNGDLNTLAIPGIYELPANTTNAPNPGNWIVEVLASVDGSTVIQTAESIGNNSNSSPVLLRKGVTSGNEISWGVSAGSGSLFGWKIISGSSEIGEVQVTPNAAFTTPAPNQCVVNRVGNVVTLKFRVTNINVMAANSSNNLTQQLPVDYRPVANTPIGLAWTTLNGLVTSLNVTLDTNGIPILRIGTTAVQAGSLIQGCLVYSI